MDTNTLVPAGALVFLVGPPAAGKTTQVAEWCDTAGLTADAVVSLDDLRARLLGDASIQDGNEIVIEFARKVTEARLDRRLTTVLDATNLVPQHREEWAALARRRNRPVVAVRFDVDAATCHARNADRVRTVPVHTMNRMVNMFGSQCSAQLLAREGFHVIDDPSAVLFAPWAGHAAEMNGQHLPGPFDIIADLHGCVNSLFALLADLGYRPDCTHPEGRMLVFVGDPNDKGPHSLEVLEWMVEAIASGRVLAVASNHCQKMARFLRSGRRGGSYGLQETLEQIDARPDAEAFIARLVDVFSTLPTHLLLDGDRLCVAHAGLPAGLQGTWSSQKKDRTRSHALFGDVTAKKDPVTGYPERLDWAATYRGDRTVVHGHVIVDEVTERNNVWCIDTGCYEGGGLTAFSWPEKTITQVPTHPSDVRDEPLASRQAS